MAKSGNEQLPLEYKYSHITKLLHITEGELILLGQISADQERNDLNNMVHKTHIWDKEEEQSEPVMCTKGLEKGRKLRDYFLQCDTNVEWALRI